MLMNMAYDAAHGVELGRYLVKLAAVVNFQLPRLVVLTRLAIPGVCLRPDAVNRVRINSGRSSLKQF